jgi:hypothetical protein
MVAQKSDYIITSKITMTLKPRITRGIIIMKMDTMKT